MVVIIFLWNAVFGYDQCIKALEQINTSLREINGTAQKPGLLAQYLGRFDIPRQNEIKSNLLDALTHDNDGLGAPVNDTKGMTTFLKAAAKGFGAMNDVLNALLYLKQLKDLNSQIHSFIQENGGVYIETALAELSNSDPELKGFLIKFPAFVSSINPGDCDQYEIIMSRYLLSQWHYISRSRMLNADKLEELKRFLKEKWSLQQHLFKVFIKRKGSISCPRGYNPWEKLLRLIAHKPEGETTNDPINKGVFLENRLGRGPLAKGRMKDLVEVDGKISKYKLKYPTQDPTELLTQVIGLFARQNPDFDEWFINNFAFISSLRGFRFYSNKYTDIIARFCPSFWYDTNSIEKFKPEKILELEDLLKQKWDLYKTHEVNNFFEGTEHDSTIQKILKGEKVEWLS